MTQTAKFRLAKLTLAALAAAIIGAASIAVHAAPPDAGARGEPDFLQLAKIHDKLHLSAAQDKTWTALAERAKALRAENRTRRKEVRAQLDQELARPEPDLARVAALSDHVADEQTTKRRQLRDEWLKFYAQLGAGQKLVVRDAIKTKVDRFDAFRERIRQRWQDKHPS